MLHKANTEIRNIAVGKVADLITNILPCIIYFFIVNTAFRYDTHTYVYTYVFKRLGSAQT